MNGMQDLKSTIKTLTNLPMAVPINKELIYKSRRPTHKIFSKGYWNMSDIDEIVNRILGEPQANRRSECEDGYVYSRETRSTYNRDKFIMNSF